MPGPRLTLASLRGEDEESRKVIGAFAVHNRITFANRMTSVDL